MQDLHECFNFLTFTWVLEIWTEYLRILGKWWHWSLQFSFFSFSTAALGTSWNNSQHLCWMHRTVHSLWFPAAAQHTTKLPKFPPNSTSWPSHLKQIKTELDCTDALQKRNSQPRLNWMILKYSEINVNKLGIIFPLLPFSPQKSSMTR